VGRRESPRGEKAQESNEFRLELILRGAIEEHGSFRGTESLERRYKADEVL